MWRRGAQVHEPLCTVVKLGNSVSSNEARVFSRKVHILETAIRELESAGEASRHRRDAIAAELYVCCRHLMRHRLDAEAVTANELARSVSPQAGFPARGPIRLMVRLLGPVRAERLRGRLRGAV